MDPAPPPNARSEFLRSPHHVVLGAVTLGLGLASATVLGVLAGVTLYALGWIHLPDTGLFRGWLGRRRAEAQRAAEHAQLVAFIERRTKLLESLTESARRRYHELGQVCRDIEIASREGLTPGDPDADPRLRKLDELMWTFLKLLGIEDSLERFLETERKDDLPALVADAERSASSLAAEIAALKEKNGLEFEKRQRLRNSHADRLEVLRKRVERVEQARANLALVGAEQERLVQQVKLIRADAVATRNADALTARIDATVEHLDETNKWLSQMDEFKDLVGDMPQTERRISFEAGVPPVRAPGTVAARSARAEDVPPPLPAGDAEPVTKVRPFRRRTGERDL